MLDPFRRFYDGRNYNEHDRWSIGEHVVEKFTRRKSPIRWFVRIMTNKFFVFSVASIMVIGCSGEMRGLIRDEGIPVKFWYEQQMDSDLYFAIVDGEQFEGRAVMMDGEDTFATVYGIDFDTQFISAHSATGKFRAVLLGSRGSTLRCLMQYADSSGFTTLGGVGECTHSDGRIIDVVW